MFYSDTDDFCARECSECDHKQKKLDEATTWLKYIVHDLYSDEPFDALTFEHCLEELCGYLGVKMEKGPIRITRKYIPEKPKQEFCFHNEWVKFNNDYLKCLVVGEMHE